MASEVAENGWLARVGRFALNRLSAFGDIWSFAGRTFGLTLPCLVRRRDLLRLWPQCFAIGTLSVPVILVKEDTLTTTEKVERAIGHVRLSSPKQIARLKETKADYASIVQGLKEALRL